MGVFIILLAVGLIIVFVVNFVIELVYRLVIKYKDIDSYKDIGELEREINVKYSPAVTSVLYDNRVEPQKDIVALFLMLELKGIISINKDKEGKYNIDVLSENIEPLSAEEEYIFNTLILKKEKFNYMKWGTLIRKEYKKLNFVKSINKELTNKINIINMLIMSILYIIEVSIIFIAENNNLEMIISGLIIVPIIMFVIILLVNGIMKNEFFNNMAIEEIKKWTKFRRFMMKYTLIKERKIEEIKIFEKYLPYSISLNVNREYKKVWRDVVPKDEAKEIIFHYRILENILLKPLIKTVNLIDGKDDLLRSYYK